MKKLSILFIGLLLVTGFAFGQLDGDIEGSATMTFGFDLDTNATGFLNEAAADLTISLFDEASAEATGDDGLYGQITVSDFALEVGVDETGTAALAGSFDEIEALIFVDPASIIIYAAPDFDMDFAPTIDSGTVEGDIATTITAANTAIYGITISVPAGPAVVDLKVASDGDWTENTANEYVIGSDITLDVAPATVDLGFTYGWFGAPVLGVSAAVELDVAPATVTLGFDGNDGTGSFEFDLAAGASIELAEANDDDDATYVAIDSYIYTGGATTDLDVELTFEEFEDGGLMDMMYATATIELLDLLATVEWNVDVAGGYDTGDVDPYFGFGLGSDDVIDINVGVHLKEGMTGIDNTTVTLDYATTDINTSNGVVTIATEISL